MKPLKITSAILVLLYGCGYYAGNAGKPKPGSTTNVASSCSAVDLPSAGDGTGQFVFEVDATVDPCSVSGYLVGQESLFKVQMSSSGVFFIDKLPAGAQDFIIEGKAAGAALDGDLSQKLGVRLSKVAIFNGKKVDQGKVTLPPDGSITGKVTVGGQQKFAGVSVYIPGTGFQATTADDGSYTIVNVPSGIHDLYFDLSGYRRGATHHLSVKSSDPTQVDAMNLLVDTGASGYLIINGGALSTTSRTVSLDLGASEDAVLMKISEDETFEGADWVPLATSTAYTFATPGQKKLYAKFANANGLESSPYSASILVDLFPATSIVLTLKDKAIAAPATPNFTIDVTAPSNAAEMIYSENSDFSGASWVAVSSPITYSLPAAMASCGSHSLYFKVKDKDNFESTAIQTDTFDVQCWQSISAVNAPTWNQSTGVATDKGIIVFGGGNGTVASNKGWFYNFQSDTWTQIQDAPSGRWGHTAVWTGSRMLIWGGQTNGGSNPTDVLSYDPVSNTWDDITPIGPSPQGRILHTAVWTGSKMIVCEGLSASDCQAYDPVGNSWTQLPTGHPANRVGASSVWTGSQLLLLGGSTQSGDNSQEKQLYAWDGTAWSELDASPAYYNYQAAIWDGSRMVAFGRNADSTYAYDPVTNSWTQVVLPIYADGGYNCLVLFKGYIFDLNGRKKFVLSPYPS